MLKLAVVRVNDKTGEQTILLETAALSDSLAAELRKLHLPGLRGRNTRKALRALAEVEGELRAQSIRLP